MESGILKTLFAEPAIIAAPAGHTYDLQWPDNKKP
jgi:hypothetical protein